MDADRNGIIPSSRLPIVIPHITALCLIGDRLGYTSDFSISGMNSTLDSTLTD